VTYDDYRTFIEVTEGSNPGQGQNTGNNSIPTKSINDLPKNVQDAYNKYSKSGWKGNVSGQTDGTRAGKSYGNDNNKLPTTDSSGNPITYKEFDVNNKVPCDKRDSESFVIGSDGSIYYTDSHYGEITSTSGLPDFVIIK